jgi:uncharacterized protein (TIGR01777 family)
MRILVSGSTGFVGSALVRLLQQSGHEVVCLVRTRASTTGVLWDPESGRIEADKIDRMDAVIHLAGENIAAKRWDAAQKLRLLNSRIKGTTLLAESLAHRLHPPRVLVSSSAVGYYGNRGSETLREESEPGRGFLADLCRQWERSTEAASQKGIRVVHMRTGIVLGPDGGALAKMMLPFKMGVGGKIGSGDQYMSWIAREDLCRAFVHAIETESLNGAVNGVGPNPVTNLEFTKTLGRVLSRPTVFPVPAIAARFAFGEMADELLLSSQRVEPARLLETGFVFQHTSLESALRASV